VFGQERPVAFRHAEFRTDLEERVAADVFGSRTEQDTVFQQSVG
jgi:hypothetical protein